MAYYSGQASSYQDLLNILVNACIEHGWSWDSSILSKDDCFLKLTESVDGIVAQGGTGKSGSTLLNPSAVRPRLGSPSKITSLVSFPVNYYMSIFEQEVFCIIRSNINQFYYLAFGKSPILLSASGLWISATCGSNIWDGDSRYCFSIDGSGGDSQQSIYTPATPFGYYRGNNATFTLMNSVISHGFDGQIWSSGSSIADSVQGLVPLFTRQPSVWSGESILLPINIYMERPQNKKSLICQFQNARFIRIDNYEPEQIINLGSELWMIYPIHKKNSASRNGGESINHSGTFGWAIRYDGP